jgi:dTDP-glucose pyrophosphorylase
MIGIIPAAGKATRFDGKCKAVLEVFDKKLIEYPLDAMIAVGIKDVIIIQYEDMISSNFVNYYRGCHIHYVEQKERNGIGKAIQCAEEFYKNNFKNEDIMIILGDIYIKGSLKDMVELFEKEKLHCVFSMTSIESSSQISSSYGLTKDGSLIEKPKYPEELLPMLGMGVYCFNSLLFDYLHEFDEYSAVGITEVIDSIGLEVRDFYFFRGVYENINSEKELKRVIT